MEPCGLCGEPVEESTCSYCGFINAKIIGEDTEQIAEKAKKEKREVLLRNISEVGIVIWRYRDIQNGKVNCGEEYSPLLSSPSLHKGTITGTSKTVTVRNGKDITFYVKTKQNPKGEVLHEKINIPGNPDTFEIGVKINERLKLDVFYHIKDGNPEGIKALENIKLGTTLVQS